MERKIFAGSLVTSESFDRLKVCNRRYITVEDGIIEGVYESAEAIPASFRDVPVTDYGKDIIIPSFSDLHIHFPQYAERGVGMDCLLFDWLNNYTFPQEAKFSDREYARIIYAQVIRDLIKNGTTQVNLFSTIHRESDDLLFEMLRKSGIYAYSGKINMDMNSPDFYVESTEASLYETEKFLAEHPFDADRRVKPILIPRFAPTCSEKLLKGLGNLGRKYHVGLHTHLVESKAEAAWARELFPQYGSDGKIYEECGLLEGGVNIFAHVIFPTETEYRILKDYNCLSVHCPDATTNITAGIMPATDLIKAGLNVSIGTDVGGGHFMGIYRQIGRAVQLSKMKEFYEEGYDRLLFANAFYMATVNGGSAFGKIGKIEPGYRFNALVLSGMQDVGYELPVVECVERFCYIGDDRNISHRFVDGKELDAEKTFKELIEL